MHGNSPRTGWPKRRRAGASVVAFVALFALSQVLLAGTAEFYVRFRDPLFGDKFVRLKRKLRANPEADVVVMLGSSRTGLAFHGKVAEAEAAPGARVAFNFGTPAAGPVTHLVYLNRLLAAGVRPKLVLVEVLPSMMADGHGGAVERHWFHADRLTASERATVLRYGFDRAEVERRWWRTMLIPAYALRFQIASRLAPSWLPWQVRFDWSRGSDECGWGTTQNQTIELAQLDRGIAQATAEYGPTLANYTPGGPAPEALRALVTRCQTENIPVRLMLMPEGSTFRALLPADGNDRLTAHLNALSHETGTPWIDARAWLADEAFYDGHHMFARGAEKFTRQVNGTLIAPILEAP